MNKQTRRKEKLQILLNSLATQMVQGSLVTLDSPCGKSSCICARDRRHYHRRYYLSWTEGGSHSYDVYPFETTQGFQAGYQGLEQIQRGLKKAGKTQCQDA